MRTTKISSRSTSKSTRNSKNAVPDAKDRKGTSAVKTIPDARALKSVSDRKLLSSIRKLSDRERETVLSILVHLVEIERRRLYLEMGYSSLYEFCVKRLGYWEATAARRVSIARCIGRFPLAGRALFSGKVTLTNLALVTKLITAENASDLLSRIAGTSKKQVELLVSSRNPRSAVRDSVRSVHVRTVIEVPISGDGKEFTIPGDGKNPVTSKGGGLAAAAESGSRPALTERPAATERRVVLEERFEVKFGADQEFISKMERLRSLLSTKHHRRLEFEELFSIVMDEYIERHSPEGRLKRKEKREQKKDASTSSGTSKKSEQTEREPSRYIPQRVRDEVYARDKGRCAYVSPAGRRCTATHDLQIDHVIPFAKGGDNSPGNLRLLCGKHNRLEAERAYGKKHMEKYVRERTERYDVKHGRKHMERYVKESRELYRIKRSNMRLRENGEQCRTKKMEGYVREHGRQYRLKKPDCRVSVLSATGL